MDRRATSGAAAGLRVSADAAARLARLEALVAEQQQSLQAATRLVDKANLRFKLYSAELKKPLQQAQSSLSNQAQVLTQLASAQDQLKQQLEGDEQLLAALHQVSAKQFQVTMQAVQKLQEQHGDIAQAVTLLAQAMSKSSAPHTSKPPTAALAEAEPGSAGWVQELGMRSGAQALPVEDPWVVQR